MQATRTVSFSPWELAAETIALKIRWFGLLFGYVLVNVSEAGSHRGVLNGLLALGVGFAVVDAAYSLRGRIFLGRVPLLISAMEALFIALLCYFHSGLESAFRYYYILSLICCAIRHSPRVTYLTWALHSVSYFALYFALPPEQRLVQPLVLTLVILGWVTWASAALALLLKRVGDHLGDLNTTLEEHRQQLEERIAERTRQLQESQAHVVHQEKMAALGLLAAGVAHEVGNPLTSINNMVQMLQRRPLDDYTSDKLALVRGQLDRIQTTLRELVIFSRPAGAARGRVVLREVLEEAVNVAKYYKRTGGRRIDHETAADMPPLWGVRDQLVQVFLNLILNAIDATEPGGCIDIRAAVRGDKVEILVTDDGAGIAQEHVARLFHPYFTTKKNGTGLGLFVTKKMVQDHGGTVQVESSPGMGTTFRVALPC
jgi:signal transduction histidine kinase